jgi:hypothetical protein
VLGIEAIDRLHERQRRDLSHVVAFGTARVPAREMKRQRHEALHERIADGGLPVAAKPAEPRVFVASPA